MTGHNEIVEGVKEGQALCGLTKIGKMNSLSTLHFSVSSFKCSYSSLLVRRCGGFATPGTWNLYLPRFWKW